MDESNVEYKVGRRAIRRGYKQGTFQTSKKKNISKISLLNLAINICHKTQK